MHPLFRLPLTAQPPDPKVRPITLHCTYRLGAGAKDVTCAVQGGPTGLNRTAKMPRGQGKELTWNLAAPPSTLNSRATGGF